MKIDFTKEDLRELMDVLSYTSLKEQALRIFKHYPEDNETRITICGGDYDTTHVVFKRSDFKQKEIDNAD